MLSLKGAIISLLVSTIFVILTWIIHMKTACKHNLGVVEYLRNEPKEYTRTFILVNVMVIILGIIVAIAAIWSVL